MSISKTDARIYFNVFGIVLDSFDEDLRLKCFSCGLPLAETGTLYTVLKCSNGHKYAFHDAVIKHSEFLDGLVDGVLECNLPSC